MEDKTLQAFSLFHIVKNFTTRSYSMKKFQDILERRIDKDMPISEKEYQDLLTHFRFIIKEIEEALKNCAEENIK